jgi:hypothetical protein
VTRASERVKKSHSTAETAEVAQNAEKNLRILGEL